MRKWWAMLPTNRPGGCEQPEAERELAVAGAIAVVACAAMVVGDVLAVRLPLWSRTVTSYSLDAGTLVAIIVLFRQVRRYAARLQETCRGYEALEHLREDLVAMLVHDLKTPLAAASGAVEAVTTGAGAGKLRERDQRLLQLAYDSQRRLDGMIGDLLAITQAEQGCLGVECALADLAEITQACATRAQAMPEAAEISITVETESVLVPMDETMMQRVIENLLANALRYTPPGGVVTVGTTREADRAILWVADTGAGVPPEDRELIFEKFGQASVKHEGRRSIGLGLTFCKYVAEAHGGKIWVENAPGGGGLFKVAVPLEGKAAPSPALPAGERGTAKATAS